MGNLIVFVEGDDDKEFFRFALGPQLNPQLEIKYFKYQQKPPEWVEERLKGIANSKDSAYIYLTDKERDLSKEETIEAVENNYSEINSDRIHVAVIEIESWYFAGLTEESSEKLDVQYFSNTNGMSKRDFKNVLPEDRYTNSNIDSGYLMKILGEFSVEEAKETNNPFRDFCEWLNL